VPVTQKTKFFNLNIKEEFDLYRDLIYFSDYAAASYGWPFYIYRSRCACLKLLPNIFNCLSSKKLFEKKDHSIIDDDHIENDNCCFCYYDAVLKQLPDPVSKQSMLNLHDEIKLNKKFKNHVKLIHANFSSDVGKPSYFVAVDFNKRKIVITIRGTESLTDSITDMQWKAIKMPNVDESFGWYGHEVFIIFNFIFFFN
jgi:sn1-specific diacylglycerol lipase